MQDTALKLMSNILKNCMNFTMIYFFYEIMEIEKTEKLVPNFRDKEGYVIYTENLKQVLGI